MTTGTEGDDQLTNDTSQSDEEIHALGGDDTITITAPTVGSWYPTITVYGGDGFDTLVINENQINGGTASPSAYSGNLSMRQSSSSQYNVVYDSIERIYLSVSGMIDPIYTGASQDFISVGAGLNGAQIYSGDGNDEISVGDHGYATIDAGAGDDLVSFGSYWEGYHSASGGDGNDRLYAGETNYWNSFSGGAGNDELVGGRGQNYLTGGTGDDVFRLNGGTNTITESAGEGFDIAYVDMDWTLTARAHVERLVLGGAAVEVHGNELANEIIGNASANFLLGEAGADVLEGRGGNDRLDGGAGADVMTGGTGHDAYWIDEAGDQAIEAAGEGTDKVFSSLYRTMLGANLENLALIGAAVTGYGNALNNIITGNAEANALYGLDGNDRLDGGAGADRMSGGDGDDTYFIDAAGDVAVEASATGGTDTVNSSVSYDLAYQHIERLFLTGTAAINATGNSLDNTLVGNSYDNLLDGGLGADVMNGGSGNDTYIVDNPGDVVIETATGIARNYDTVRSSVTFHIPEAYHIEALVLTGTGTIDGYGNSGSNRIEGNSNNNILNGGGAADTLIGHGGDDTYYVDDIYDRVFEDAGGGTADTVYASVNFDLASKHIETLVLTGTADLRAWGNSLANRIYGNSGDNWLDGRTGADFMNGGGGNDTYYVDNVGDRVVELAGGGTDEIHSSVSFDLAGIHVETLRVYGPGIVTATGNSLANTIYVGGAAGSAARGLGGDDWLQGNHLYGGTGNDILYSVGSDTDRFFFDTALNASTNVDTIRGFDTVGYDQFQLSRATFKAIDAGVLGEDAFHEGSAAADAEDRIVYNVQTGEVFYDADGSGAGAAILFARVEPGVQLDYFHFFAY